jgi:CRISPR type I-E-associated protein CasB/Cse2
VTAMDTSASPRDLVARRLSDQLRTLCDGARRHEPWALRELAALRQGAARQFGESAEAAAALLRAIGTAIVRDGKQPSLDRALERLLDDAMLVASLVAVARPPVAAGEPDPTAQYSRGSFGKDFAAVCPRRLSDGEPDDTLMRAILGAQRDDLPFHLRRAVTQLGSHGGSIDVGALVRDLGRWDAESRVVQRRWAYDFYTAHEPTPKEQ